MAPKIVTEEDLRLREQVIIDAACKLIAQDGFARLTMDRVVAAVPYSKGSIYKQINSLEELLLAITNQGARYLLEYMALAANFSGNSREQFQALCYAYLNYALRYPIHFQAEIATLSPHVIEKASAERVAQGRFLMREFFQRAKHFVTTGIENGDLSPTLSDRKTEIAQTSWSLVFGFLSLHLASQTTHMRTIEPDKLLHAIAWSITIFLDGLDWAPRQKANGLEETWNAIKQHFLENEVQDKVSLH